ncbi:MAG: metallophosphoesterase [Spirulinaceae cyanobacterium]
MKRRKLLILTSVGGLGLALASHKYLTAQDPLSLESCPDIASEKSLPLLRFAALGDIGTGDEKQYKVAKIMSCYFKLNPFSLVLLAGDNIYRNGEIKKIAATFEKPYHELLQQNVNFYAVLGNHDIRSNNGIPQIRYPGFNMQGRYYSFTRGPVQFFALNSNPEAGWSKQLVWLEEKLAESQQPWKVVFGHHQMYSSGKYGVNQELIERLKPLFSRYNVQLYINGHEHHYERTQPIKGTTYLTCGAGAKLRPVGESDWTAHAVSRLSFAGVEVYSDRLEICGIGTDGQVFDRGIIS